MAQQFNTGKVQATVSGGVNMSCVQPSATQTLKLANGTGTGALQTMLTVTAGKTAYIMGISTAHGAAGIGSIHNNAGTQIFQIAGIANTTNMIQCPIPLTSVAATETLKCLLSANVTWVVFYYEV